MQLKNKKIIHQNVPYVASNNQHSLISCAHFVEECNFKNQNPKNQKSKIRFADVTYCVIGLFEITYNRHFKFIYAMRNKRLIISVIFNFLVRYLYAMNYFFTGNLLCYQSLKIINDNILIEYFVHIQVKFYAYICNKQF